MLKEVLTVESSRKNSNTDAGTWKDRLFDCVLSSFLTESVDVGVLPGGVTAMVATASVEGSLVVAVMLMSLGLCGMLDE